MNTKVGGQIIGCRTIENLWTTTVFHCWFFRLDNRLKESVQFSGSDATMAFLLNADEHWEEPVYGASG